MDNLLKSVEEELIRQELPIQSIYQRGESCTSTVPVHLSILELQPDIRTNCSLIKDARETVKRWYEKDMRYYLGILKKYDINLPWLKNYEEFQDDWTLRGRPDNYGFLELIWKENEKSHSIQYVEIPVVFHNQHNELGEFITPEDCMDRGLVEVIYRNTSNPEQINMSPEKMLKYGKKSEVTNFDLEKGIAEVVGNAFCSDYHDNMAKNLLLRNFAVFYLNQLLSTAHSFSKN